MDKKELTSIQISRKTLSRLRALKMVKKESYDELLTRLMNQILGGSIK